MKRIKFITLLTFGLFVVLFSCKVEPKIIAYGKDHCHFCDMIVVDKTHAAQYVTKKGKAYVFDTVECLVSKINAENNEDLMSFILVTDYSNPGVLVDANKAMYLISEKIKSPMGANLSAFSSKKNALKAVDTFGGELFTWSKIKIKLLK